MKKIVDSQQMKQIDDYAIETIGIPSLVLMENAANQVVHHMADHISQEDIILVACGSGNNGGDGMAIARILLNRGYQVDVFFAGKESSLTTETAKQMAIIEKLDMVIWDSIDEINISNYTIVVDALIGIGLQADLSDDYMTVVNKINEHEGLVFAVDMPTGISADNGKVMKAAVQADYTISFGYRKIGQLLFPGSDYCGEVSIADIGFPPVAMESVSSHYYSYDQSDLATVPRRKAYSNKGTFGRVLVIAGSENMSGAAYLSAKAAYRTGAGFVEVLTTESNRNIIQAQVPEAVLTTYNPDLLDDVDEKNKIKEAILRSDTVVIGPGIGIQETSHQLLDLVTLYVENPVVFDADAINVMSNYYDTFPLLRNNTCVRLNEFSNTLPAQSIITPHLKELARLMDRSVSDLQDNLLTTADQCAKDSNLIYAIKDARTIVTHDHERYINDSGNSGMATAGSGDVLTGIIAGLLAQGLEPFEAAKLAVYIHGLAGDQAAKEKNEYSMMASDIIEALHVVLKR